MAAASAEEFLTVSTTVNKELKVQKFEMPADINCFQNPFAMIISGPTMCGKSTFIYSILKHKEKMLTTDYSKVVYYLPAADLHSAKRQEYIRMLKTVVPRLQVETGLPKESDCKVNNLPKLFIIGKLLSSKTTIKCYAF
jgi:pantothenate kinase-related protein Tda10